MPSSNINATLNFLYFCNDSIVVIDNAFESNSFGLPFDVLKSNDEINFS